MNFMRVRQSSGVRGSLLFAAIATLLILEPSAQPSNTAACTASEYRQFDFWIGDWDAFDADNPATVVARIRVKSILNGCVLHEDYKGTDGHEGESFSIYDASSKLWRQSWVTNRGQSLIIEGNLQSGRMILTGVDHSPDGKERTVRGTWQPLDGAVRETAVTSTDRGKTWKPWFDLIFRVHQP